MEESSAVSPRRGAIVIVIFGVVAAAALVLVNYLV
jgi:hypothetical protein